MSSLDYYNSLAPEQTKDGWYFENEDIKQNNRYCEYSKKENMTWNVEDSDETSFSDFNMYRLDCDVEGEKFIVGAPVNLYMYFRREAKEDIKRRVNSDWFKKYKDQVDSEVGGSYRMTINPKHKDSIFDNQADLKVSLNDLA